MVVKEVLVPLKSALLTFTTDQSKLIETNSHLISVLSKQGLVQKYAIHLLFRSADVAKMDIPVPGKRYKYRLSHNQPPNENSDYFPIYNVQ